jgi:hypothetical protein
LAISQPNKNTVVKDCDIGVGSGLCWVAKKRQSNLRRSSLGQAPLSVLVWWRYQAELGSEKKLKVIAVFQYIW